MPAIIPAIYEEGVFKPIEYVNLKEHQQVEILVNVIKDTKWESAFKTLLDSIHRYTAKFSSTEIEDDITFAAKEVKEQHHARISFS